MLADFVARMHSTFEQTRETSAISCFLTPTLPMNKSRVTTTPHFFRSELTT